MQHEKRQNWQHNVVCQNFVDNNGNGNHTSNSPHMEGRADHHTLNHIPRDHNLGHDHLTHCGPFCENCCNHKSIIELEGVKGEGTGVGHVGPQMSPTMHLKRCNHKARCQDHQEEW